MKNKYFICNRIKDLRKKRNFKQEYMATSLGFENVRSYVRLENNETSLSVETLLDICKILNINVYELLDPNLCLDGFIAQEYYTPRRKN